MRDTKGESSVKIWFDTEFIEDGETIDLISIGAVREDGLKFYAENADCDLSRASDWVKDNVIVHLTGKTVDQTTIAKEMIEFAGGEPEFWAYYCSYDWVALCQLYGTMMDLPKGWPMFCRDLKQYADFSGVTKLPEQGGTEHHALADALWTRDAWTYVYANVWRDKP